MKTSIARIVRVSAGCLFFLTCTLAFAAAGAEGGSSSGGGQNIQDLSKPVDLKYRVYVSTPEGRVTALGELVTGTSVTIPSLYGTTHYWWAAAVRNGRESEKSAAGVMRIPGFKVGDIGPGGGYVFYDKGSYSDGWRYLEAAPESAEFNAGWYDAVRRCKEMTVNGLTGWRLPDKDELNFMYWNLQKKGLGGFGDFYPYWSSPSKNSKSSSGWYQRFSNGNQNYTYNTGVKFYVRGVRTF
jgi:hypothetical protein